MIGRIIKRLLYVFGVLGIFLVAIGLGVVIWMWDSHQPADPEWLRMDDRFPVPHGAKVVDKVGSPEKGRRQRMEAQLPSPTSRLTQD